MASLDKQGAAATLMLVCLLALPFVFVAYHFRAENLERKQQSAKKLKAIAKAFSDYIDFANLRLPPAVVFDQHGNPLYSWRVLLLPFLGEEELYKQFKLNEPWDSDHNIKLLSKMPAVYRAPGTNQTGSLVTHYQVFNGYKENLPREHPDFVRLSKQLNHRLLNVERRTLFVTRKELLRPITPARISSMFEADDEPHIRPLASRYGTYSFVLVAEAGEAVPWTKPADLAYSPDLPLPPLGALFRDGFHAVTLAGHVEFLDSRRDERKIRSGIASTALVTEGDW